MKVVRVYTGVDNKSHFEDVQVPLKDGGKLGFVSELTKATGVVFRETGGDYDLDFHTRRAAAIRGESRGRGRDRSGRRKPAHSSYGGVLEPVQKSV